MKRLVSIMAALAAVEFAAVLLLACFSRHAVSEDFAGRRWEI